jgi:hypothetical protein
MCTTSINFLGPNFASGKRWMGIRQKSAQCANGAFKCGIRKAPNEVNQ